MSLETTILIFIFGAVIGINAIIAKYRHPIFQLPIDKEPHVLISGDANLVFEKLVQELIQQRLPAISVDLSGKTMVLARGMTLFSFGFFYKISAAQLTADRVGVSTDAMPRSIQFGPVVKQHKKWIIKQVSHLLTNQPTT